MATAWHLYLASVQVQVRRDVPYERAAACAYRCRWASSAWVEQSQHGQREPHGTRGATNVRHDPSYPGHLRHPSHPIRAILLSISLPLLLAMSGCGGSVSGTGGTSATPVSLAVFAAASLQAAFNKIGDQFHTAHSNATVTFNFGGSDALATQ